MLARKEHVVRENVLIFQRIVLTVVGVVMPVQVIDYVLMDIVVLKEGLGVVISV